MTGLSNTHIRSVDRTLGIIQALQDMNGGTATEVAEYVDLPKSTVHNHLQTLYSNEYITKNDKKYYLGLRFLEHGGYIRDRSNIFQVGKEEIKKLAENTGELANLLIEEHGRGVYLYRECGEQAVELDSYAGKRQHLHSTAFGKAMLAFMSDEQVHEIIEKHGLPQRTDKTVSDPNELLKELKVIRDRGYAYDDEESLEGLRCVAAPIQNTNDDILGAVSVSGPISRMQNERFTDEIPDLLLSTTNIIEINTTFA